MTRKAEPRPDGSGHHGRAIRRDDSDNRRTGNRKARAPPNSDPGRARLGRTGKGKGAGWEGRGRGGPHRPRSSQLWDSRRAGARDLPGIRALRAVEPQRLLPGRGGEAESFPLWSAEVLPQRVGVFDVGPE
ncbi:hypothetical protein GCM10012275_27250 [Longimycelium tulufanense]|uniref:Uncharacterized protein n=1 Tax=Longimycelium tulufanense TaxID=907463 RepID=A0A8J3CEG7_9PSEU|nr:hypothetical protein GCM10012275_27250 [Longimycelium tulufanense]